ncbi:MAG: DNA recombination protein RmuC [Acholeplasmataceae bacterium]
MGPFEYAVIGLLSVLVIAMILVFLKLNKKDEIAPTISVEKDIQGYFNEKLAKEFGDFKTGVATLFGDSNQKSQKDLNEFKDYMMAKIDTQLKAINDKVEERLGKGFEQTTETFTNVIERLTKIDEAQKKIETLSEEVVSLNGLLTDKKTRGIFGEVQLYQLLTAVMGDNKKLYEKQITLSNGYIADAMIHAPKPLGNIVIDSKFPLDNYKRMMDKSLGKQDRSNAEKEFKKDVKIHINAIKDKYIIPIDTADQAIMFIPAEAIFAELTSYHEDIMDYAQKNQVWIASPTTLLSTLTMIQTIVKNMERDEQTSIILDELRKLGEEFKRYDERWDKLNKAIVSVSKHADLVDKTGKKISKKFSHIKDAKFDEIEEDIEDDETIEIDVELEVNQ